VRIQRGGPAVAGLALCFGALVACGGSSGGKAAPAGETAEPPTTGATTGTSANGPVSPKASEKSGGRPLAGKVVVIDPGHNGGNASHPSEIAKQVYVGNGKKECDTTGTDTVSGYSEHAFTWDVSKRLAKILQAEGAKVTLTRKSDTGVGPCVNQRAAVGNEAHADAAISIHGDGAAASGHGFHIIEPLAVGKNAKIVAPSARLGTDLRDAYHSGTGIPYSSYLGKKGIDKRSDLGGLNMSTVPKVFIECGNMRNKGDAAKMTSASGRQQMAEALAKGFETYLT
jgi:N-acetylmuramoyl-L-alanine amidase